MSNLQKFFITGFPRSGTTYLSVILNSQENILCIESALESLNNLDIVKGNKYFNIVCSTFENEFAAHGHKPPNFRSCNNINDIKNLFYSELKKIFNVEIVGMKNTRRSFSDVINLLKSGIKVIVVKRNPEEVILSNLNKFINLTPIDVSIKLKAYNKNFNNYDLSNYKNILVVDYSEMRYEIEKLFIKLSDFLQKDIYKPDKFYYSWNKNKGEFYNNSSFGLSGSNNLDNTRYKLKIKKYSNFVEGKNYLDLTLIMFLKNLKKKLGTLL